MELVRAFEGGAVYKVERDGKFILLINQHALLDLLDDEDRKGIDGMREMEFSSEAARNDYLKSRGWL